MNICFTLTQNRPRQQRKLLELVKEWHQLILDVSPLFLSLNKAHAESSPWQLSRTPFHSVTEPLRNACRVTAADLALEAYLAGLELDLYDVPCEEGAIMFWAILHLVQWKADFFKARASGQLLPEFKFGISVIGLTWTLADLQR